MIVVLQVELLEQRVLVVVEQLVLVLVLQVRQEQLVLVLLVLVELVRPHEKVQQVLELVPEQQRLVVVQLVLRLDLLRRVVLILVVRLVFELVQHS